MKIIKDPLKTTCPGVTSPERRDDIIKRIQDKMFYYGIVSDREYAYLERYVDLGPTRSNVLE